MVYWAKMYKYEVLRHKKATKTILLTLESVKNIVFVAISYYCYAILRTVTLFSVRATSVVWSAPGVLRLRRRHIPWATCLGCS